MTCLSKMTFRIKAGTGKTMPWTSLFFPPYTHFQVKNVTKLVFDDFTPITLVIFIKYFHDFLGNLIFV